MAGQGQLPATGQLKEPWSHSHLPVPGRESSQ